MYNAQSLNVLYKKDLKRWCFPVELSQETLSSIMQGIDDGLETEVFAFGKLPLAFSARCFTARAYNLDKDDCQYKCIKHDEGLLLSTKEDESFLIMNGIQTLSSDTFNLVGSMDQMQKMGVDIVRISPQVDHSMDIVEVFRQVINQEISSSDAQLLINKLIPEKQCDGYWFDQAGKSSIELVQSV